MAKYRILSIDGGGIRGIIPVILLERLGQAAGAPAWIDQADLIAGTSTGGLIALALAAGKSLSEILGVYTAQGAEIFERSPWRTIASLGSLVGAKYDIANLKEVVEPFLGPSTRLSDLQKRVLIASFDLDSGGRSRQGRTWKPKLFHNFPGEDSDGEQLAWKVGLQTSAAPTYFAPFDGFVDGGVYAANPSMCALAQTQDPRNAPGPSIDEIVMLSLGTGLSFQHIAARSPDWGDAQWIERLLAIMLDSVSGIADYQCRQILRERYFRISPVFPARTEVAMDAVDQGPYMIEFAQSVGLADAAAWIRHHWL